MDFPLQDRNCRLQVVSIGSHGNPKRIGGRRDQRWKNKKRACTGSRHREIEEKRREHSMKRRSSIREEHSKKK
jgi:hypothetical protein